jgi:putative addiction module killer protein
MDIKTTAAFDTWLKKLRDQQGRVKILARFDRLLEGNAGNVRALGDGVIEMRIDFGPGYRVYFRQRGLSYVMLCGGDKSTQARDIAKAKALGAAIR